MGPVSRKASGRTPGRKGLEVSGRAAWTGWASSLGPPRAGQLPCLSEPGNPQHFLAHAEVGEEGRRLLLSRPRAGGHEQQEERAGSRTSRPGDVARGPGSGTLGQRTRCCVGRSLGAHKAGPHIRDGSLCLSQTPPRPASRSRTSGGDKGRPNLPGPCPPEGTSLVRSHLLLCRSCD